jgi:hypothetical protein
MMAGSGRGVLSLAISVVLGVSGTAARVQDAQKSRTYNWVTRRRFGAQRCWHGRAGQNSD